MKIYKWNRYNKEYIGEYEANLDPLETKKKGEDVFALPMFCTFNKPDSKEGMAYLIDEDTKEWIEVEDNRGQEYWMPGERSPRVIKELQEEIPEEALTSMDEEVVKEITAEKRKHTKTNTFDNLTVDFNGTSIRASVKNLEYIRLHKPLGDVEWVTYEDKLILLTVEDLNALEVLITDKLRGSWNEYLNIYKAEKA